MNGAVRSRLSLMMFLEYAVWGVWAPILALYLQRLESFRDGTATKINMVYLTMAIASMLSPFVAGQLADRYFSTERFLAFSHLVGGLLLLWASQVTSFQGLFLIMLGHCILYAPTIPLTNSLAFHHLPNSEKDFGAVRLWGTIGWIAIGWAFSGWLGLPESVTSFLPRPPSVGDCLLVGGLLSFIMAAYCLTLPHTPPSPRAESPWAFLTALKLTRNRSFAVMLVVAFLVSTELQFYYVLTPNFFGDQPVLSLSLQQIEEAGGMDASRADLLLKLLDTDGNKKLSKTELEAYPKRLQELKTALSGLGKDEAQGLREVQKTFHNAREERYQRVLDGTASEQDLRLTVQEAQTGKAERSDEAAAAYVIKVVNEKEGKVKADEVSSFLEQAEELKPNVQKTEENFADRATEKGGVGLSDQNVPRVMTIGQFAEIVVLLILPWALARLGFTLTIALGIFAWAVRYALFAWGRPEWAVIASQGLHGFGYGFFFVGCMIYSDRIAPKDIRASAQGLFIFVTFGLGMLISSLVAGPIADYFQMDWHRIFLVPVGILVVCTILFLAGFRPSPAIEEKSSVSP
jgi:MFS family permease